MKAHNPYLFYELVQGLFHLFLPRLCEGCRKPLLYQEEVLCMACNLELPRTDFQDVHLNEAAIRIAGRIPFEWATAFAYFSPDGLLQYLLHRLKYQGKKEIGLFLGRQFGYMLRSAVWIQEVDALVPVPLHPDKLALRGYNQASLIATGLSEILAIPVREDLLRRCRKTESQTRKSREERVLNVREAFQLSDHGTSNPGHIILLDDVLTTGATLEAAALELLKIEGIRISVLCVGLASQ